VKAERQKRKDKRGKTKDKRQKMKDALFYCTLINSKVYLADYQNFMLKGMTILF